MPTEPAPEKEPFLQRLCDRTFRTFDGTVFTHIETNRGSEMMSVRDPRFRSALRRMVQKETGKPPSEAPRLPRSKPRDVASQGPVAEVHVRVAVAGGRIYLDLADDHGRVVEVGRAAGTSSTSRRYTLSARRVCGRCRSRKAVGLSTTFGQWSTSSTRAISS